MQGKRKKACMDAKLQNLLNLPMRDIVAFWNSHILPGLWSHYKRLIRRNGVIVLFGAGMLASELMRTGRNLWRHNLVWEKNHPIEF